MMKTPWSGYSLLPASADRELGIDDAAQFDSSRWSARDVVARALTMRRILLSIGALVFLIVFIRSPSLPRYDITSSVPSGQRPRLDFIQTDGDHVEPEDNAVVGTWPQDYVEAARNLEKNGRIPSVRDPWPKKPWIASTWLANKRFPDNLPSASTDLGDLPVPGQERGRKLPVGLRDPPRPSFPVHAKEYKQLPQIPREELHFLKSQQKPDFEHKSHASRRKIQADSYPQDPERKTLTAARRDWVKRAFLHAWEGYKAKAFGHDETAPVSGKTRDGYNAWGATTIDALDLLLIMNLTHEYNIARTHARNLDLTFVRETSVCNGTIGPQVHLFENVIRYLGGFLSAYDLSGDELMLRRAKDLGDWLLPAFSTNRGFPVPHYVLGHNPNGTFIREILAAEVGSLSMELTRLSQLTGDAAYYNAAYRIQETLASLKTHYNTLVPYILSEDGRMAGTYTSGGMTDSYYEYEVKMSQLLGDTSCLWGNMYQQAVDDMYHYLMVNVTVTPDRDGLILIGARSGGPPGSSMTRLNARQEHLATFAGGMFGLGSKIFDRKQDLAVAKELTESAIWSYQSTATGLMPEIMDFYGPDQPERWSYQESSFGRTKARQKGIPLGVRSQPDPNYKGRPEAIESVFYMYRITGDPIWQDHGWRIFTSWIEHALVSYGFANIVDVNKVPASHDDIQESFVLTETLKYYYLLFSPEDLISLDDYVFNTEAHPFRLGKPLASMWPGPELDVDLAYGDARDHHLFRANAPESSIPYGRGTAEQQLYKAQHC